MGTFGIDIINKATYNETIMPKIAVMRKQIQSTEWIIQNSCCSIDGHSAESITNGIQSKVKTGIERAIDTTAECICILVNSLASCFSKNYSISVFGEKNFVENSRVK